MKISFVPVMFHQLHCLRSIVKKLAALDSGSTAVKDFGHVEHCLNYLRQTLLCRADGHLESGDYTKQDFDVDRVGDTRVCRDWSEAITWIDNENGKSPPIP